MRHPGAADTIIAIAFPALPITRPRQGWVSETVDTIYHSVHDLIVFLIKRFQRAWEDRGYLARLRAQVGTLAAAALLIWLYAKVLSWCNGMVTSAAGSLVLRPAANLWAGLGAAITTGLFVFAITLDLEEVKGTHRRRPWSTRMLNRGSVVCVCVALLLSLVAIRKHLTFKADSVVYQPDFAVAPTVYKYDEITGIILQPYEIPLTRSSAAHASYEPAVVLQWKAGDRWALVSEEFDIEQPEVVAAAIAQRAGVPLQHSQTMLETPGGYYIFERALFTVVIAAVVVTSCWSLLELLLTIPRVRRKGLTPK